jgi:adenylate cyclase
VPDRGPIALFRACVYIATSKGKRCCGMAVPERSGLTGRPSVGRKLTAVVHADMAGYSRLIGLDDAGTLGRLRAIRRDVMDPALEEHGGRIVNTGGDSLLMVFDSIDAAVRCAVKVQQQVPIYDGDQPPDRTIRFRVGINVGDVIPDGSDVHGDVVNVAARLQAECPPGGVCVSRAVRDHVQDRLDLAFDDLGALKLKNIARPVEAFVVNLDAATNPVQRSLVHDTRKALALPDKPSIAVLAFTNMSRDPEQEYFSDGIAEDIITELSRSRLLFVIARNSSFTYSGRAVDVKQIARELGVRYVLEGSVRRSGGRLRITAQLIEAETGNHIWAERYDRMDAEIFAVQDEITTAVTTAIHPAVADAELRRVIRKPPENLGAWEAYQRGLWHMSKYSAADNERAIEFFHRAIALDEGFASAYVPLVTAYYESGQTFASRPLDEAVRLAGIWAHKAAVIDPQDAEVQVALGSVAQLSGRLEDAWDCASLALSINPNSPRANNLKGALLVFNGQSAEGRKYILAALRLSPRDPRNGFRLNQIAMSYYYERDYADAAEAAKRTIGLYPDNPMPYRWLAAALGQLGQVEAAHKALNMAMSISPKSFALLVLNGGVPWRRPEDHEHMLDGLRKAGWQG